MTSLDDLDSRSSEPLRFTAQGRGWTLVHPRSLSWMEVAGLVVDVKAWHMAMPGWMTMAQSRTLHHQWLVRHDLDLTETDLQSLCWRMSRFTRQVEIDLPDSTNLWQERRWGLLSAKVDRLPRNSATVVAMLDDDEYVAMVKKARAEGEAAKESQNPIMPRSDVTSEVDLLMGIYNQLEKLRMGMGATAPGYKPTMWEVAKAKIDEVANVSSFRKPRHHDFLVSKLLPVDSNEETQPPEE